MDDLSLDVASRYAAPIRPSRFCSQHVTEPGMIGIKDDKYNGALGDDPSFNRVVDASESLPIDVIPRIGVHYFRYIPGRVFACIEPAVDGDRS